VLTQAIENLLNRNLPRSPRAQDLCAMLNGKRVRIEAGGLGWVLVAECLTSSIRLTSGGPAKTDADAPPDAEIAGSLMSLAALAGSHPEEVIRRGDVTIRGDAELAQKFRELAMLLRPDVEEELSRLIGDTPAHQALRLVKSLSGFGRRAAATGVRNVAEYLAHERRDLVPRAEAEDFYRRVETLRDDLDRLEARTRLLEAATASDDSQRQQNNA
jgi:ubiquinone biosynthesis protein UbiJ